MNKELRIKVGKQGRFRVSRLFHNSYFIIPTSSQRGFTILIAVLIGTLLFTIGLAIAHLSVKEVLLSAAGKQSEAAFFAADTGIECALYHDLRVAGTFPASDEETGDPNGLIECNDASIELHFATPLDPDDYPKLPLPGATASAATTTFRVPFAVGCADVTVGKTVAGSTVIESRGSNDCGTGVNPGRVERALRVRY